MNKSPISLNRTAAFLSLLITPAMIYAHPDHDEETTGGSTPVPMTIQTNAQPVVETKPTVSIQVDGEFRVIRSNGIPDHQPGTFPRRGNPNTIKPQSYSLRVPLHPKPAASPVHRGGYWWGVAVNGVPFEPGTAESWNNDMRSGWRYEAGTGFLNLGLDEHNAHVQPNGSYHYHALPNGLVKTLGGDEKKMLLVAWSADGFPVYTAQAHASPKDANSPLRKMKS
ncbi:MAG: YHYH protein, partial [Verrucomicrobia bacterium]|nr:YHYH protein [Verrucomicrobiota bacterium]